jgi:hypothetical protein
VALVHFGSADAISQMANEELFFKDNGDPIRNRQSSLEGLHADDGVYWFVVRRIWHRFVTGVAAQRKFRKPKEFNGGERGIRTRWKAE